MRFLKNFLFGEGKGLGQKNVCFVFAGPNGNCLPILKKQTHGKTDTQTDTQTDILLL